MSFAAKKPFFTTCAGPTTRPKPPSQMLRARPELFAPIVTHALPIENIQRAFEMLEHKQDGSAKIVLNF